MLRTVLVFLYVLATFVSCDSTFRFGAVLSTKGHTKQMAEARNGYELYFKAANSNEGGGGFFVEGKPGTSGYFFHYNFTWYDDEGDPELHSAFLQKLLAEDNVHFLGGSHERYAEEEMRMAQAYNRLVYQCCVEPDIFYDNDYQTAFGITASNKEYTRNFIRTLLLTTVTSYRIVYDEEDILTRTTCEAALGFFEETGKLKGGIGSIPVTVFNGSQAKPDFFQKIAATAKRESLEAMVACVRAGDAKKIVNALHEEEYSLKALFFSNGPARQSWADSLQSPDKAIDLYSAVQWHPRMKYSDSFFGSALKYTELYQQEFNGESPSYLAAGASAVGLTLTEAIRNAFRFCDISRTNGDVDALLYNAAAIECDDSADVTGFARVINALAALDSETFFGRVKFSYFRRNIGLETVTTQVFERELLSGEKALEIDPVMPVVSATRLPHFPATNHYPQDCKPGFYVGQDAFDPCTPCGKGEESHTDNAVHCDSCPIGEWNDKLGQSKCQKCPEGTVTEERGAANLSDCGCKEGFYNALGQQGMKCEPCPEGARCAGGTNPPVPMAGYWANATYRNNVYMCDPPSVCLGGENVSCETGYTGRLCSECEDGYFSIIQRCYKCFAPSLVILLSIVLLIVWYVINVIVSRSVSSLEMILGWAQLANIIGDVNLNWTNNVTAMFGVANILDFDVDILEPSCVFKWGFRQNLIIQLCLPFIMSFMAGSGYITSAIAHELITKRGWIKLKGKKADILSFFVKIPEDEEQLQEKWDATIATFLASVDITYVTIAKYCFDVFKCEDIAGVSVLREAPNVSCGEGMDHVFLGTLSAIGIVFYVVGYPICVMWKLYDMNRSCTFSDPVNIRRFGFIYEKYELDYYFTPALSIIRKFLFVLTLVYLNNPAFQIGALAIVINISLMIHTYTAPYVDSYLDVLFSFLLVSLMGEAFGGLMFYSENLPQANRKILDRIVVFTIVLLTVVFFAIFSVEIRRKYHVRYLKNEHQKFVLKRNGAVCNFFQFITGERTQAQEGTSPAARAEAKIPDISYELLETFKPDFIYGSLRKEPDLIEDWDKLTHMLKDYMSDQSDTSYLSLDPVAKFWRKLINRFPELIDFLAVADDETRKKFNEFATNLYRNFYLTKKVSPLPLMEILNWRDYAPMAQWLAIAPSEDRQFFVDFIARMFSAVENKEAAETLKIKLQHDGVDPHLEHRLSRPLTRRQRRILRSLTSGSHPLRHSASQARPRRPSVVSIGISKLRRLQSRKKPPQPPERPNSAPGPSQDSEILLSRVDTENGTAPSIAVEKTQDSATDDPDTAVEPRSESRRTASAPKSVAFNLDQNDT